MLVHIKLKLLDDLQKKMTNYSEPMKNYVKGKKEFIAQHKTQNEVPNDTPDLQNCGTTSEYFVVVQMWYSILPKSNC